MSDSLKPLLQEDADEFERALLGSSATEDRPPRGARDRAMAAVGLASSASSASASPGTGASSGVFAPKWIALAAVVVAGSAVLAASWERHDGSRPVQAGSASANESAPAPVSGEIGPPRTAEPEVEPAIEMQTAPSITPNALPNAPPEPKPAVPSARRVSEGAPAASTARPRPDDDALARETLLIDEARHSVAKGDVTRALSLLDVHDRDFPSGVFSLETAVLRIEALERAGLRADADRLGREFLGRHTEGSYVRRVRAVRDRIAGASGGERSPVKEPIQ